jgi:outer membrane lipoprotein LolB
LRDGAEVRELDPSGRLRRVVDQGWTIEYIEYAGDGPDAPPRKIDVHRGETRLRLIVDAWNP